MTPPDGNGDAAGDATEEAPALDALGDLVDDGDELGPAPADGEGTDETSPDEASPDATSDELGPAPGDQAASSASDEQPVVVFGVEDSDDGLPALGAGREGDDELLPEPDLPGRGDDGLVEAYTSLEIRTPPEELEAFARGRDEALARLGQVERAAIAGEALKMAQAALRRVMGSQPREAP